MFRLVVADLDSPSYFVATAAVELGFFREEGIDAEVEREYGALNGPERLREGSCISSAVRPTWRRALFPAGRAQSSCARCRNIPTGFLAVRADLDVKRGDLDALKGLRISSSTACPKSVSYMLKQCRHRSGTG